MTQAAQFAETYVTPRLFARLALVFGALAALLVATGLYGTLVYRVQRRRSEIGVRMAVGAQRADVLMMVLRESLLIASAGLALGLPMSLAVSRLLRTQLYRLSYLDPASFGIAVAFTLLFILSAALLPARKASQIEPMGALRSEPYRTWPRVSLQPSSQIDAQKIHIRDLRNCAECWAATLRHSPNLNGTIAAINSEPPLPTFFRVNI